MNETVRAWVWWQIRSAADARSHFFVHDDDIDEAGALRRKALERDLWIWQTVLKMLDGLMPVSHEAWQVWIDYARAMAEAQPGPGQTWQDGHARRLAITRKRDKRLRALRLASGLQEAS